MVHLLKYFLTNKIKEENDKKDIMIYYYLKSLIRYENDLHKISNIQSFYFSSIYINKNLYELLMKINHIYVNSLNKNNVELDKDDVVENKKKIILKSILKNKVNYDDFETLFLKYFKINQNDYLHIKEFVKPFYKEKKEDKNILKCIFYLFYFYISYTQFYMIIHEFLEIKNEELEYYLYLFIYQNEKNNKEKMRLIQKELKYEYFDFYINQLFKIFYLTIHFMNDITKIIYDFDIHDILLLKKEFFKKILFKKID